MAQLPSIPRPDDYKRALQRVKKLWNDGLTEFGYHAQRRMVQRQIDSTDVANCIKYGRIIEHSKPMTLWRYAVEGNSVDGERMKCIVEINGQLIIVTVI